MQKNILYVDDYETNKKLIECEFKIYGRNNSELVILDEEELLIQELKQPKDIAAILINHTKGNLYFGGKIEGKEIIEEYANQFKQIPFYFIFSGGIDEDHVIKKMKKSGACRCYKLPIRDWKLFFNNLYEDIDQISTSS